MSGQLDKPRTSAYVIGRLADFEPGSCVAVDVNGRSIAVFNIKGKLHALLNRCPHQGAELCKGTLVGSLEAEAPGRYRYSDDQRFIRCPWHGWEFDLETGRSYFDARVRHYDVDVQQGDTVSAQVAAGSVEKSSRREGPLRTEVYEISIDEDYVVLHIR